ncbi:hypothetical protein Q1695_009294 [Nippostrongylus brasiliensis]|nr:hypothetical protein Q1695_009294 [Nippostrongylus brasiliensis]
MMRLRPATDVKQFQYIRLFSALSRLVVTTWSGKPMVYRYCVQQAPNFMIHCLKSVGNLKTATVDDVVGEMASMALHILQLACVVFNMQNISLSE